MMGQMVDPVLSEVNPEPRTLNQGLGFEICSGA